MRQQKQRLSGLIVCLSLASITSATELQPSRPTVFLQSGATDALGLASRKEQAAWHASGRHLLEQDAVPADSRWGPLAGAQQWLISFQQPVPDQAVLAVRDVLEQHGGWLGSYVPDASVLGVGPPQVADALQQIEGVVWVGLFLPEDKLAPAWEEEERGQRAQSGAIDTLIDVSFPLLHGMRGRELSYNPAAAAEREWAAALRSQVGAGVTISRRSALVASVSVPRALLKDALAWLSGQPAVHWLAPRPQARLHNWQGTAVTQSASGAPAAPIALSADEGTHPIWGAGLTGTDQVIGAGDSGMDYNHCFFADPAVSWADGLTTDSSTGVTSFNSTQHRKIRLYRDTTNGIESSGHGTHTMGSLLGASLNASNLYNLDYRGIAPDAKLAFTDLGSNQTDGIFTPEDLATNYFPFAYSVGARVHSDSWGSSSIQYDYMASEVDLFTWQNQDFTSVFAAGNEGSASASSTQGATTVTSPATAKNCITVGATEVAGQASVSNSQYVTAEMSVSQPVNGSGAETTVESYMVMQAAFGGQVSSLYNKQLPLSVANPQDGCGTLQNSADIAGTVVLIQRGTCYISSKVANAQAAGAMAAMVYDNQINDYFLMLADGNSASSITIPGMAVPRRVGQLLASATQSGNKLVVSFGVTPAVPYAWANLAPFSSKGPTQDGRIKPDLLAPGTLQSAWTDGSDTCALRSMQGTSMATPLIAGSAALVRQYFLSGRYPTGQAVPENSFAPSGALVKAVLIGGAAGLSGFEPDTGLPLAPPPSFRQGFGRVQLSQSLPLQGSGPGWSMQLVDRANLSTGQTHQYCVQGVGGPLTVTLVWHDYPAMLAASKALVNDLDLTVRAAGLNGFPLLGNGGGEGATSVPDRTNNVEQVAVSYLPAGDISIQVDAYQVFAAQGPQPYSLVVLGKFTGMLASASNPVNGDNSTSGTCQIVLAEITAGPTGLTNATTITFSFGRQSGSSEGIAFECSLTNGNVTANAAGVFSACSSPVSYAQLADGSYNFYVRAQGEQLADSRSFFKDTQPPQITFEADILSSSAAAANFSFGATDLSAVAFQCRLSVLGGSDQQGNVTALQTNAPALNTDVTLGVWQPCFSPLVLHWLLPGNWTFEMTAVDGAGNVASQNPLHSWLVAFEPGQTYTRFASAPLGPIALLNRSVSFQAFQQAADGKLVAASVPEFQCLLNNTYMATDSAENGTQAALEAINAGNDSWTSCGSPVSFRSLLDGDWALAVRAGNGAGAEEIALTSFNVDSTPPSLQVVSAPGEYTNSSSITIDFFSNTSGTVFECQLIDEGNSSSMSNSTFQPCSPPVQLKNLTDGAYVFRLSAADRVGNRATPEEIAFQVDTAPPAFSNVKYPLATRDGSFSMSWDVSDGEDGSGLAEVDCRMRPVKLVPQTLNQDDPAYAWRNCSSPESYTGLAEGRWGFTLRATDYAGLQQLESEMSLWVESQPPVTAVSGGPLQNQSVASSPGFTFSSRSGSDIGTPIAASLCRLVAISSETAAQFRAGSLASNASLPGTRISPTGGLAGSNITQLAMAGKSDAVQPVAGAPSWGDRQITLPGAADSPGTAQGLPTGVAESPSGGNILQAQASLTSDGWQNCTSPVVYQGLGSGNYSFQVKAVDVAGNAGGPTDSYLFAVDASLPVGPPAKASFWGLGWKFWLIVGGGGALVLAILVAGALACWWCCRRRRRMEPHGTYVSQVNTVATPRGWTPRPGTPRTGTPRLITSRMSTPRCALNTPRVGLGTPRLGTPRLGTPRLETPRLGASTASTPRFDTDEAAAAIRAALASRDATPPMSPSGRGRHEDAVLASLDETRLRIAMERSLADTGQPSPRGMLNPLDAPLSSAPSGDGTAGTISSGSSDVERRSLLASTHETDLRRALALSLHGAAVRGAYSDASAPPAPPDSQLK